MPYGCMIEIIIIERRQFIYAGSYDEYRVQLGLDT